MDVIKSVQNYLNKMVSDVTGMKVLLLDSETTPVMSVVLTQTQLLSREVYLIDKLANTSREKMRHLKCICFVRPTAESIQSLVEELRDPCYGEYYLYFSNALKKSHIERLAEVDEHEVVREVQEYFADFLAINPDLFSLNISDSLFHENSSTWDNKAYVRCTEGLLALFLALKKKPLIRYEKNSLLCRKLAAELHYQMQQEGSLYEFRKADTPPLLLILDRRNDPVTPLLNQWTYQAMIHELVGIQHARVDLGHVAGIRPELKEIVLSVEHDPFYAKNMYLNLGDLGINIKSYVDEYQVKHKSSMNIESIEDMKKFMEDYPEFRKLSGNVTKHVTLVGELSRIVEKEALLEISELEQSLACAENHPQDVKALKQLLERPNISAFHKAKLVMLYALHYEKMQNNSIKEFTDLLQQQGVDQKFIQAEYAGTDQRQEELFSLDSVFSRTKAAFKGLKGVENVYTQHTPLLLKTLDALIKGKLKDGLYPFIDGSCRDKPQDIIVFMVGGATYAEAREVERFNRTTPGVRVVLGGTDIHNIKGYLGDVVNAVGRWTKGGTTPRPDRPVRSAKMD